MEMGGSRKETENKNGVIARRGLSQALVWVDGWMDGWMDDGLPVFTSVLGCGYRDWILGPVLTRYCSTPHSPDFNTNNSVPGPPGWNLFGNFGCLMPCHCRCGCDTSGRDTLL
jgi:hypothetical protein